VLTVQDSMPSLYVATGGQEQPQAQPKNSRGRQIKYGDLR